MNERYEELAALNAFSMLEGDEKRTLEGVAPRDRELRTLCSELEQTVAELAYAVLPVAPPAALKNRIKQRIHSSRGRASYFTAGGIGWALAASLAVSSAWLWNEREQLSKQIQAVTEVEAQTRGERDSIQKQIAQLGTEFESLKKRDVMAQMQISTLQSSVDAYKQGVAVVVWDSEKHNGVLKLEKMPPVEVGKDYQLWVVDPKQEVPVDAGVVHVDAQGFAKIDFKPLNEVSSAAKFALSVEKEGGVPKGEGPIVLIGP